MPARKSVLIEDIKLMDGGQGRIDLVGTPATCETALTCKYMMRRILILLHQAGFVGPAHAVRLVGLHDEGNGWGRDITEKSLDKLGFNSVNLTMM